MTKAEIESKMLGQLVNNALDFLRASIKELEGSPKYSVIHFHAAIELFLKARLLADHWTLVVAPRTEADWQNFTSGSFVSVSMEDANTRLQKVVQSGLSEKQLRSFRTITKHRNLMVHFFHEAESAEVGASRIQAIVKEQLTAWYFLHFLLLDQWGDVFEEWKEDIAKIDQELRKHHEFLRVVFNELRDEIAKLERQGSEFLECPSCGFESDRHDGDVGELYESECLVCGLSVVCVLAACDDCDQASVLFQGTPSAMCSSCDVQYDERKLIDMFVDEGEAYLAAKEGGHYPFPLNCGECCGYETVVEVGEDQYLCTECFAISESYGTCEWCNDESTDLGDDTFWRGCEFCDGRAGWDKD